MDEEIHYAWGESSMGEFIAAVSERGLVAFEFADSRAKGLVSLRERVGGAQLAEDPDAMAPMIRRLVNVVDAPGSSTDIPLDPRGGEYERMVWQMLRDIPAGETTSYGELAAKLGTRDARDVTAAIAANGIAILIPCHRVVKKDGSISGYRWGVKRKRALLELERKTAPFRLS